MVKPGSYERKRQAEAARQRSSSLAEREIGALPGVRDPARKEECGRSFRRFCEVYFRPTFYDPFSPDHLKVIGKIETSVREGGLFCVAMPRGSGKTALCEAACLWALLYGYRRFVLLVGADAEAARRSVEAIKMEVEANALLADDFPEVCYPVARLERITQRTRGQLCGGRPTYIGWGSQGLALPVVDGSRASGGVVKSGGLEASLRGMRHKGPDGKVIRPDLIVCDDPQTDESAVQPAQCAKRERLITGAVLGMAQPGKAVAGIMPCTVIAQGDLADSLLDHERHPEWRGERTQLVYGMPGRMDLWDQYRGLRRESLAAERGGAEATAFYRANRAAMDAGCTPAWPERFDEGEESAVQHAMNFWCDRPDAFWAEGQNAPRPLVPPAAGELNAAEVVARLNRHDRGLVPRWAQRLTCFIDVQQDLLWYAVCGWGEGFTGAVLEYGAWPGQGRPYWTLANARPTVSQATGVGSLEGSLYAALEALGGQLLGKGWPVEGGPPLSVERCLIDSGWQAALVQRYCRQSAHRAVLLPSKGMGIHAGRHPMGEWKRSPGQRRGDNWVIPAPQVGEGRLVVFDSNHWKSFLSARLKQPLGEPGALTLYGDDPRAHRMLGDHLTAEYPVRTSGLGRDLDEWKMRPGRDNHLLDCLAGCAVAASERGCALAGAAPKPGKRVSYRDLYDKARGRK